MTRKQSKQSREGKHILHDTKLGRNCKILPFEFSKIVKDKKEKFDKRYL